MDFARILGSYSKDNTKGTRMLFKGLQNRDFERILQSELKKWILKGY